MSDDPVIRGAKGGSGSQHTPVESPDSLRSISYFRILDLVSEGEIAGLVNGQQSIYLDDTPLANADGSINFPNAHIEQRNGTQDQTYIPGFDSVENEISIGVELKQDTPWLRSISDTSLSAVRVTIGVPSLSKANTSNGDITGYSVAYKIEISADGGAYVVAYNGAITGKTTTKFQRSHRLDLPVVDSGWQVRVTRITANANSSTISDTTTIDSYTEIVDAKLRYPNSAVVGVTSDASQFSNIPTRAYDLFGRIIRVPANYDVKSRTYATTGPGTSGGAWDGSFKLAWTDNPAWVFYDLALHTRYGLGHLIDSSQIDKWELYRIAQYCDQMVSDGKGGTEPRFTCNVYLQSQADAYKLLNDLSSVFRGISYWAGGSIVARSDMPGDPTYTYTNANVIGGTFTYSSSGRKTRFTTALVTWNDPLNFYRSKVEYVEDRDGIARYGIQQTEVTAIGCTSQGQAQRIGRWLLLTSRLETDTCTFSVGLDGTISEPGQIIRIADAARSGKRQGGRVHSATASVVTVDKAPTVASGDTLTVNMGDGISQTRTVTSVAGNAISVSPDFTAAPDAGAAWTVESTELAAQTFRVLAVTEDKSDSDISFTLTCLQHNASKFAAVDSGTLIQIPPISSLTPKVQAPPTNVTLVGTPVIVQGAAAITLTISWAAAVNAVSYDVEWRKDDGQWVSAGNIGGLSADVVGVHTGDYIARVRARNSSDDASIWTYSGAGEPTTVVGKTGGLNSPTLTAIGQLFGIKLLWAFSETQNQTDNSYTEIKYNTENDFDSANDFGQFAYPVNMAVINGLLANISIWAWARVVDKSGNTSNWAAATAITSSTADLFKPITDAAEQLRDDVDASIAQVQVLQGQIGDILQADEWADDKAYLEGDLVQSDGKLYRAIQDAPAGTVVTDTAFWQYIGNYSSLGEAVAATAANVAINSNNITQAQDDLSALSETVTENAAAIADKADASALETTNATVEQHGDEITASAADIALLGASNAGKTAFNLNSNTVKIDGDETLAETLSGLQASYDGLDSRVDSEELARVAGDTANASAITAVQASQNNNPNLLTNPTARLDLSDWGFGPAPTSVTRFVDSMGSRFSFVASDGSLRVAMRSSKVSVTASTKYTAAADLRFIGTGLGIQISIECFTASDVLITPIFNSPLYNQPDLKRFSVTLTTPANCSYINFTVHSNAGEGAFAGAAARNLKFEIGDVATPYTEEIFNAGTANTAALSAQAATSLTANVGPSGAYAQATTMLDVNGHITGVRQTNDGTTGDFIVSADKFAVVAPSGTPARTEYSDGNWRVYDSAGVLRVQMGVW